MRLKLLDDIKEFKLMETIQTHLTQHQKHAYGVTQLSRPLNSEED